MVNNKYMKDKKNFIETLSRFHTNPEDEDLGVESWDSYYFDINSVIDFNEATDGYTTITIITGNRWIVAIKIAKFKELIENNSGVMERIVDSKADYEFKEQQ